MPTYIITDRKIEDLCGTAYRIEPEPVDYVHIIGPLAFMEYDRNKKSMLSGSYDRVDFGVDPEELHIYKCAPATVNGGEPRGDFHICMYDSPFLVPFACWYLRRGGFIAIHQYETGWHTHYHPVIRTTVSPAGTKEISYWSLDMDGIFMFRSRGGTYEPMAHLFDELGSDRPEYIGGYVWMFPREKTDVKGLIERVGPVHDLVLMESIPPSENNQGRCV